jgi:MoaA/NifB/PqqE/SkfB family radical SAM enzyme
MTSTREHSEHQPHFVVNDLVIQEDTCNLACEYCLTGQSQFKEDHTLQKIFDPPRHLTCEPGTELHRRLAGVLEGVGVQDVPVVKISGGEVLLIRGIMGFVQELGRRYETVVILTNGIPLSESRVDELQAMQKVVLQISLDASRYRGNSYRVQNETIHQALMQRIHRLLASGLPVEIYLVLNDRSIEEFENTCEDLARYGDHVTLFPFPVRGPQRQRFLPRPDQYEGFFRVLDQADRFGGLLPSEPYRQRLQQFFREGGRGFRCHLPRIAFTSFDDGAVTSCPNIWFNHVGNILDDAPAAVMSSLAESRFRRLLLADRPRIDACKACYTPWDPVSLYFDGQMTLAELAEVPVYRGPRTQERLQQIRDVYLQQEGRDAERRHSYA